MSLDLDNWARTYGFDSPAGSVCTPITAGPDTTVTDQELLNEAQFHTLETPDNGASFSDLWTVDEVISYLNQRKKDFLKRTGVKLARETISTIAGSRRHALPQEWIGTRRVMWRDLDPTKRVFHELPREDMFSLDHGLEDWERQTAVRPKVFTDADTPTLTLQTAPATTSAGVLEVLYVSVGRTLSNTGVVIDLPTEFTPAIKWGVIASMLGKVGRAHDPSRAALAESRYELGVEAARLLLRGLG